MRYLIVFVSVFLSSFAAPANADCVQDAARAQQRIENLLGEQAHEHRTELAAVLVELCQSRPAGASVVRTPDRKVITTYGLNEGQVVESSTDTAIIVGVDAVRRRDGKYSHDPEERPRKRRALQADTPSN